MKILRKFALTAVLLALAGMIYPVFEQSGTEMKFPPGAPNPNLYRTTLHLGRPLPWIGGRRDQQEMEGLDDYQLVDFRLTNFIVHSAAIGLTFWIYFQVKRNE